MSHGDVFFSKPKEVYGADERAKEMLSHRKNTFAMSTPKTLHHETNFKLARREHGETTGRDIRNTKIIMKGMWLFLSKRQRTKRNPGACWQ